MSSDSDGEIVACVNALRKYCNLNDLGNLIEGNSNGEDKMSKKDMQYLYDAGYKDGLEAGKKQGFKDGLEEGKKVVYRGNPFEDVLDNSDEESKVIYCDKHKSRLKSENEKDFVESCLARVRVYHKALTPPQLKWINDIYKRLGGK